MPRPARLRKTPLTTATTLSASSTSTRQSTTTRAIRSKVDTTTSKPSKPTKKSTINNAQVSLTKTSKLDTSGKIGLSSSKSDSLSKSGLELEISGHESTGEEKENKVDKAKPVSNAPITRKARGGARKEPLQVGQLPKQSLYGKFTETRHEQNALIQATPRRSTRNQGDIVPSAKEIPTQKSRRAINKSTTLKPTMERKLKISEAPEKAENQLDKIQVVIEKKDKGKGKAIESDGSASNEQHTLPPPSFADVDVPSSPPTRAFNLGAEGEDEDESIYGDENCVPDVAVPSTPKAKPSAAKQFITFREDEGYTPTHNRFYQPLNPVPEAGASSDRNSPFFQPFSPVKKRLWESSTPTSPSSQQDELIVTASIESDVRTPFDIYEDPELLNVDHQSQSSQIANGGQDASGDGPENNVLRTPNKTATKKRTSSGGIKSPDGIAVNYDNSISNEDISEIEDEVIEVEQSPPKKRKAEKKIKPLPTKDLLAFVPKRRKEKLKPHDILDDMGDLGSSSMAGVESDEDEITKIQRKPKVATTSNPKAASKFVGSKVKATATGRVIKTTAKKSTLVRATATTGRRSSVNTTPVKTQATRPASSTAQQGTRVLSRTYGKKPIETESFGKATEDESLSQFEEVSTRNSEDDDDTIDKEGNEKLREIKEKFDKVDVWELDFEDVSPEESG